MGEPDGKRRLPLAPRVEVAQPADEDRPPWHWTGIGAVGVFVFWLPQAMILNGVIGVSPGPAAVALNAAAFALAAAGAGLLVGRFGGAAGRREAAASGVVAAVIAWLVTSASSLRADARSLLALGLLLIVITALGGGAGWIGGAIGVRLRR